MNSTPVTTPCTPRRLSLAESFTNLREHTKTTSTSLGLVHLLQEQGISAAVYNPHSWDRTPKRSPLCSPRSVPHSDTMPSTPPNSPTRSKVADLALPVVFGPADPPYENFLASRPASTILKEVQNSDPQNLTDPSVHNLRLLDKVKRFSLGPRALTPGLGSPPFGSQPGRPGLPGPIAGLSGIRRNRSYPVMVGASMAMKGAGPPVEVEDLLLPPRPRQTSVSEE